MRYGRLIGMVGLCALVGCTDATSARIGSLGNRHKITMYSGGEKVGEWTSTGRPRSVGEEDGWQFVDASTQRLMLVTGDCVIECLPD